MEKVFVRYTKRIKSGHLWIYNNEISSDIKNIKKGSLVKVYDSQSKKFIGTGYANAESTISIRLMSYKEEEIDRGFFKKRILEALNYREKFLGLNNFYRLVYSESDFLPGLIVDRYEKVMVIQILTAGMENFKEIIVELIDELFNPEIIILRNDTQSRLKEGLLIEKRIVKGEIKSLPFIYEDGIKFIFDPLNGQKTGFFLDQRENRNFLKQYISYGEGLDMFCYLGAWSLHIAKKGVKVKGIDSSDTSINLAKENAKINNLNDYCTFIKADAFDYLKWEIKRNNSYDFVVLDPPAFVKNVREKRDAFQGYLNLNIMAIKLIKRGGILATSSCSQHVSENEFLEIIKEACLKSRRKGIIVYKGTQAKDHPILLNMPETHYLKCFVVKLF